MHSSFSLYCLSGLFPARVVPRGLRTSWPTTAFYPLLLPKGQEERAYTVSAMLYPILKVLMMPLAAVLYDKLGVGRLLLIQAALSVLAAFLESRIRVQESRRDQEPLLSLKTWWRDVRGSSRLSAAGARPARALCVHVCYQRHGLGLFSLAHRLFPHGAGLHYRHGIPFSPLRNLPGAPSAEPSATATSPGEKALWLSVRCISDL